MRSATPPPTLSGRRRRILKRSLTMCPEAAGRGRRPLSRAAAGCETCGGPGQSSSASHAWWRQRLRRAHRRQASRVLHMAALLGPRRHMGRLPSPAWPTMPETPMKNRHLRRCAPHWHLLYFSRMWCGGLWDRDSVVLPDTLARTMRSPPLRYTDLDDFICPKYEEEPLSEAAMGKMHEGCVSVLSGVKLSHHQEAWFPVAIRCARPRSFHAL